MPTHAEAGAHEWVTDPGKVLATSDRRRRSDRLRQYDTQAHHEIAVLIPGESSLIRYARLIPSERLEIDHAASRHDAALYEHSFGPQSLGLFAISRR